MKSSLLLMLMVVRTVAYPHEKDLLMYCSFDQSPTADFARGRPQALTAYGGQLTSGCKGQAWDLRTGFLEYESRGNIANSSGTIAFWFKPSWDSGDPGSHYFVAWGSPSGDPLVNKLSLYFGKDAQDIRFFIRPAMKVPSSNLARATPTLAADSWHHLAVTWEYPEMRIYLDGEVKARCPLRGVPGDGYKSFVIGANEAHGTGMASVLDEFYIYGRALNDREISALREAEKRPRLLDAKPLQSIFVGSVRSVGFDAELAGALDRNHGLQLKVGGLNSIRMPWSDKPVFILPQAAPPGDYLAVLTLLEGDREIGAITNQLRCLRRPGQ
ncbi:MAG: LamG domain-containing protein [Verrucomicrobiia bacterium]